MLLAQGMLERLNLAGIVKSANSYLSEHGPAVAVNTLAAIAIFVVGRWAAKIAVSLLKKVCERTQLDETLAKFLCHIAYTLILLFVVMAALDRLGVNTTSFAAIVAAAGLAIGLALQGSLANFSAGVMIILFRPFKVGDFIEAGGASGVVEEIHIFHTLMRTIDNVQLVVPNNAITAGNISNYSAKPTRRIDLTVGCGYGDNLQAVKQFLCSTVNNDERILRDPEPIVAVGELGDNSVNFFVRPWVANADYWQVRWDLIEAIKVGFDQHGFSIPFPQRDVHIHQITGETRSQDAQPSALQASTIDHSSTGHQRLEPIDEIAGVNQTKEGKSFDFFTPGQSPKEIRPRRAG